VVVGAHVHIERARWAFLRVVLVLRRRLLVAKQLIVHV